MKKYFLVKESKRHSVDEIIIEKESQPIQTNIGIINLNGRQLGRKKNKPKFKNNPNKVFMKRKK